MSLLNKIKSDSIVARKAGDKETGLFLTTLFSEAESVGRNVLRETTDEEVIAVVKKFIKNAETTIQAATNSVAINKLHVVQKSSNEIKMLNRYLPVQLSEDEIISLVAQYKAEGLDMKGIMAQFKLRYGGRYDGATVAVHAR